MTEPLLHVSGLVKHFPVTSGVFGRKIGDVRAVDDVSFDIHPGETLGLVGESGCGKTTVGRCVLRLLEPTAGKIVFEGKDTTHAPESELRVLRRKLQVIFQDPFSSLNPRMRVVDIVGEAMEVHGMTTGRETEDRVVDLLRRVGLSPAWINRYPHEFSGGQRQRIGIARAIALEPKLLVCDEAVSALDVSIQAQIINLLTELRREMNLAYLFIAHDLSVVRHLSHRVAVMYLGEIAELAPTRRLFAAPSHPYTRALLSAIPVPDPTRRTRRLVLQGDVPTPRNPPSGCRFHTRCPAVMDRCRSDKPPVFHVEEGHDVACLHAEGLTGSMNWFEELSRRIDGAIATNSATGRDADERPDPVRALRMADTIPPQRERPTEPPRLPKRWKPGPPRARSKTNRTAYGLAAILLVTMLSMLVTRIGRHQAALSDLGALAHEIAGRKATTGAYPNDLDELGWRLFSVFDRGRAIDPWGQPYRYRTPGTNGRPFELGSTGPDGVPSRDDIGNVPPLPPGRD
jgi:oligopeptide transport system ATP-binding protein